MPTQLRLFSIAALACCQVGVSGCASVAALAAAHPAAMAAAAEMLPVAAVMGGIGLLGVTGLVSHQGDTFEPGTLGALLNDRQVAVAALAGAAMQDQREVTIAAALEVDRGIVRARIALRDQLNRKPEAQGEEGKAALAAIDSAIAGLAQVAPAAVRQAGDRARVAADKLAVPAQVPQVRSFGPVYLFSFLPFQTMTVRGDFPERYPDGAVPRLTINGKSVAAYAYDAQSLAFSLPAGALGTPESQAPVWTRADLSIPWDAPEPAIRACRARLPEARTRGSGRRRRRRRRTFR